MINSYTIVSLFNFKLNSSKYADSYAEIVLSSTVLRTHNVSYTSQQVYSTIRVILFSKRENRQQKHYETMELGGSVLAFILDIFTCQSCFNANSDKNLFYYSCLKCCLPKAKTVFGKLFSVHAERENLAESMSRTF